MEYLLSVTIVSIPFIEGKGYVHGRRAANVHLAIRTANYRGRYCCRVNSPEMAHGYSHGRRVVSHAFGYLHGRRVNRALGYSHGK